MQLLPCWALAVAAVVVLLGMQLLLLLLEVQLQRLVEVLGVQTPLVLRLLVLLLLCRWVQ